MKVDVVPVNENFRGLSYGQWAAIWDNWLMSADPDNAVRKDIAFLRGNLDYAPVTDDEFPRFADPSSALIKTDQNAEIIFENTAVFIPVLTAHYSIGDIYDGKKLNSDAELREAVNKDSDESLRVWALIKHRKNKSRIVGDLRRYRVESPLFKLSIATNSKLRQGAQDAARPGLYDTVVGGFFLIIRSLPRGKYRLEFGGSGRGNYNTSSVYDITVEQPRKTMVMDSSSKML